MLDVLIVVVLALHLMCVNVAAAGPLVCIWFDWRSGRDDALANRVGQILCGKSLVFLLVGGLLGLILGWLHWDQNYQQVLSKFPSKIFFGVWELVFSLVLISLTAALWRYAPQARLARWGRAVLLVLTGTNLLYHFPFLFAIISRVHAGSIQSSGVVDASAFRGFMMQGSVLPEAIHFGMASFAMVGVALLGLALWDERSRGTVSQDPEQACEVNERSDLGAEPQRIAAWGGRLALGATVCQIPVGIWLVVKLAPDAQQRVMGADLIATGLLGASIMLSMGLLHHLAALALGVPKRKNIIAAIGMMLVLVTMMTGVLQRL